MNNVYFKKFIKSKYGQELVKQQLLDDVSDIYITQSIVEAIKSTTAISQPKITKDIFILNEYKIPRISLSLAINFKSAKIYHYNDKTFNNEKYFHHYGFKNLFKIRTKLEAWRINKDSLMGNISDYRPSHIIAVCFDINDALRVKNLIRNIHPQSITVLYFSNEYDKEHVLFNNKAKSIVIDSNGHPDFNVIHTFELKCLSSKQVWSKKIKVFFDD